MEYVKIISTIEILGMKSFQCHHCLNNSNEDIRKGYGCNEIKKKTILSIKHYGQSIDFYTCPGNYFDFSINELIFVKEQFDKGVMPYGGDLMNQPAKFIEAVKLIDLTQNRLKEENKKAAKKNG